MSQCYKVWFTARLLCHQVHKLCHQCFSEAVNYSEGRSNCVREFCGSAEAAAFQVGKTNMGNQLMSPHVKLQNKKKSVLFTLKGIPTGQTFQTPKHIAELPMPKCLPDVQHIRRNLSVFQVRHMLGNCVYHASDHRWYQCRCIRRTHLVASAASLKFHTSLPQFQKQKFSKQRNIYLCGMYTHFSMINHSLRETLKILKTDERGRNNQQEYQSACPR